MPTPPRYAVAIGHQGFGNVGDESILAGIEAVLAGSSVSVRAVVAGNRAPVAGFPKARRLTSKRLLPTAAAIRELRAADLVIIAGGGLFNDHWRTVVPKYLAWTVLARMAGTGVAWVGIGVGPLHTRLGRRLTRRAARLASLRTVRDRESLALLGRIAPGLEASIVPDPAFFLPRPTPPSGRRGVALMLRAPLPSQSAALPRLRAAIAGLIERRRAEGTSVELLSMAGDLDLARELAADTGAMARALPAEPMRAIAELSRFSAVASMRLHGLILAAVAGTPCLPVSYDPKVAAVAHQLGLAGLTVELPSIEAAALDERLHQVAAEGCVRGVQAAVERLRAQRDELRRLIERAADG